MSTEPRAHARLSPSGSAGWLHCPHWENDGKTSVYAAQGTMHHNVAAAVLQSLTTAAVSVQQHVGCDFEIDGHTCTFGLDEAVAVEDYIGMVLGLGLGRVFVEVEVPIDHITGEEGATGTADFVLVAGTHWHVVDAKFGHGIRVRAKDNTQLIMYALGAIRLLIEDTATDVKTPEKVTLHIAQPYLSDRLDSWTYRWDELWDWGHRLSAAAHRHVVTNPENLTLAPVPTTDGCRYCVHAAECSARRGAVEAAVGTSIGEVTEGGMPQWEERLAGIRHWEPEQLGAAFAAVEFVRGWCKAVEGEAIRRARAGERVPGHKLVAGKKGTRSWAEPGAVEKLLRDVFRMRKDQVYGMSLKTPAQLEKVLAKKQPGRWEKVKQYIQQAEGEPSLAPLTDPRPELRLVPIADEFDNLDDGSDLA